MMLDRKIRTLALCAALGCVLGLTTALPSFAQETGDLMPPAGATVTIDSQISSSEETHPPLRLTPDQSQILELNEDIERVIIGSQTHLNILMDTSRRVIVVPRAPGATTFTLLGAHGKVLMNRHAIVAAPKENYIRIRQSCATRNCEPVKMYYCPGMCHEMAIPDGNGAPGASPPLAPVGQSQSWHETVGEGAAAAALQDNMEEKTEE